MWWFVEQCFGCLVVKNMATDIIHDASLGTCLSVLRHMPEKGIITGVQFFNFTESCPIVVQNGCINLHICYQYVSSCFYITLIPGIIRFYTFVNM